MALLVDSSVVIEAAFGWSILSTTPSLFVQRTYQLEYPQTDECVGNL